MQTPAASPAAQPTTDLTPACYVCDATDDLRVAYRYWPEDRPPSAGKLTKWLCRDDRRCCANIDRKYAARECAA